MAESRNEGAAALDILIRTRGDAHPQTRKIREWLERLQAAV